MGAPGARPSARCTSRSYKDGVTTFDNADLWKQLDVQVHSRIGSSGAFTTAYVGFDQRSGNNARYAIDLNAMDPFKGFFTIQNKSDCPAFPLSAPAESGGAYVEVTMELYFTINGVELRPAPAPRIACATRTTRTSTSPASERAVAPFSAACSGPGAS